MATSGKFQSTYNSKIFKKQVLLEALQVQFKYGTYPIIQISSSKVPIFMWGIGGFISISTKTRNVKCTVLFQ